MRLPKYLLGTLVHPVFSARRSHRRNTIVNEMASVDEELLAAGPDIGRVALGIKRASLYFWDGSILTKFSQIFQVPFCGSERLPEYPACIFPLPRPLNAE